MTSEYDMLMSIHQKAEGNIELRKIAEWLFDICIEQTNKAKEGWSFEHWKKMGGAEIFKEPFEQKARFLDACHDVLAHKNIDVFDIETQNLITIIYKAFNGQDVYDVDKVKKRFPELPEKLEVLGYKPLDKKGWMWTK